MTSSAPHAARSAYRSDIDGLRAVAVLLVVFNHLLKTWCRGGYVGVDVFFVISGYLIGATILAEMRAGAFSLASFYERRIRRIFPALFVMLVVASGAAYLFFLPSEMVAFSKSLIAALLSVSNMLFWAQSGYFDVASESKPLLHTWSLGVEEQFYIVFPLFLLAVHRWFPRAMKAALWSVVVVSLAMAAWFAHRPGDTTAFFVAPLRSWELLLGAIASQGYLPKMKTAVARHVGSLAGLLLILVPAMTYTSATPFPGLAAVPPVAGAVLLIGAGETGSSVVGRLLSWRPVVFIGLISYSLYLWHWPLKVFWSASLALQDARYGEKIGQVIVFIASLVLATLSWRFVETPFRKGRFRPGRRRLFVMSAWGTAFLGLIAAIMIGTHGMASRFSPDVLRADQFSADGEDAGWRQGQCFLDAGTGFGEAHDLSAFDKAVCMHEDPGKKHYLLYGDSHAADKYAGLASVFPELDILQATVSSCPPLLEEAAQTEPACREMSAYIFGDFLIHHPVDGVLLSAHWNAAEIQRLGPTVAWLKQRGIPAIVIGPGIEYSGAMPQLVAVWMREGRPAGFMDSRRLRGAQVVDQMMKAMARSEWKVPYISVYDDLCRSQTEMVAKSQPEMAGGCPIFGVDGAPLLLDTNHFSKEGSILFARAVRAKGQLP
jgi:peptidoglycan/LPS O-acetylase OafA/YrhL